MSALKLIQIVEIANLKFPFDCSEPWDNSGIQVGDLDRDIKNIAFSLDANPLTINYARQQSCELLITHHPILINPVKNILKSDLTGQTIMSAISLNVDVLSLHTNLDASLGGINDFLAQSIGLCDVTTPERASCARVGNLDRALTLRDFNALVIRKFQLCGSTVVCGHELKAVSRVFLVSGSGAGYFSQAVQSGADVLVTGDVKYHTAVDAIRSNLCVIDAGHYGMEKHTVGLMARSFRKEFEKMGVQIGCHECPDEKDPFVRY